MKDKLTKEEVLHVLNLARLEANDEEIAKYQVDLKMMIDEIDKIKNLNDFSEELLIAPWQHDVTLRDISEEKNKPDLFLNAPRKKGNFIEVGVEVINND